MRVPGVLPPDGHVHTEWSWDAVAGSMERTCERAIALGLRSIAFTEHADFTVWSVDPAADVDIPEHLREGIAGGLLRPPELDVPGYLACIQRCRDRFPDLRIRSGLEVGEPHWHPDRLAELVAGRDFDRILGSLHSLTAGGQPRLVDEFYLHRPAAEVVRDYLGELLGMVGSGGGFAALAHIDYPIRYWPAAAGPYRPEDFEEEHRAVLRALAGTGRALEVNTTLPLDPQVVRWWYEERGEAVCFGSDAHEPDTLARGFAGAAAMVESCGFRPGRDPDGCWLRSAPG